MTKIQNPKQLAFDLICYLSTRASLNSALISDSDRHPSQSFQKRLPYDATQPIQI
jgi:hypothetical protein